MSEWRDISGVRYYRMPPTPNNKVHWITIGMFVFGAVTLLLALGILLNPKELAKADNVEREIRALSERNNDTHGSLWGAIRSTQEELKAQRSEQINAQEKMDGKLEKIDSKLWQVLNELKTERRR